MAVTVVLPLIIFFFKRGGGVGNVKRENIHLHIWYIPNNNGKKYAEKREHLKKESHDHLHKYLYDI